METIIINEIAWMGTEASANDEWIELYNKTDKIVNLDGWEITTEDGTPSIKLKGEIEPYGFFILERTNDDTLPDIAARQIYTGALNNKGENLKLTNTDNNVVDRIDNINAWFAGDNGTKQTMERKIQIENSKDSWQTSKSPNGSPNKENSSGIVFQKQALTTKIEEITNLNTEENENLIAGKEEFLAGSYNISKNFSNNTGLESFSKVFLIAIVSAIFFWLIVSIFKRFLLKLEHGK